MDSPTETPWANCILEVHQEKLFVALESQGRCPGLPLGKNIWVYEMNWHSSAQAHPWWMKQWHIPVSFTSMVTDCPKCYQEKKMSKNGTERIPQDQGHQ